MKKRISALILCVAMCCSLTACGNKENMLENMDAKNNMSAQNISIIAQTDGNIISLSGVYSNGLSKLNMTLNGKENITEIITDGSNAYLKNGDIREDLQELFGELEESSSEYIQIKNENEVIGLNNIDSNVVFKYFNSEFRNKVAAFKEANPDLIVNEDGTNVLTLTGEAAQAIIHGTFDGVINNIDNIYNEIVSATSEEYQAKLNSTREKNTKKLKETILNHKNKFVFTDYSSLIFTYKNSGNNGSIAEIITIMNGETPIFSLNVTTSPAEATEILIPEDFINISAMAPLDEEEQAKQLDDFFNKKYPKASEIKADMLSIGYSNAKYTTSLNGISIYASRDSKSAGIAYSVIDEINVVMQDDWISEVVMVSCISKKDFDTFGMPTINEYISEMEQIIGDTFILEIGDGIGYYENILEGWEFSADIKDISINNEGIITVKLVAKQH